MSLVPDACSLTAEQRPARLAELDALLAGSVTDVERAAPTLLRLRLHGAGVPAAVRDVVDRERACCPFFDFAIAVDGDRVLLDIAVPQQYTGFLDGLAERVVLR